MPQAIRSPHRILALLVTAFVLILVYRTNDPIRSLNKTFSSSAHRTAIVREDPSEDRSEKHVALKYFSRNEEHFTPRHTAAVLSARIPDHGPFLQDFRSNVVSFPWINDSACREYEVRLGVSIPPVYLVSFPRSGNTWTRYLVEGATGIFTGSVYDDKALFRAGYLGEFEKPTSKNVLLIKHHLFDERRLIRDSPMVLIIRDPRKAVASFLVFEAAAKLKRGDKHLFRGSASDFTGKGIQKKILSWISLWEKIAKKALENPTLLVLLYEDIKADPLRSVRAVLNFLKVPPDEGRLRCLRRHVEGKVNRGQPELDVYTAEQDVQFRNATRRVSDVLKSRGFAPLPY